MTITTETLAALEAAARAAKKVEADYNSGKYVPRNKYDEARDVYRRAANPATVLALIEELRESEEEREQNLKDFLNKCNEVIAEREQWKAQAEKAETTALEALALSQKRLEQLVQAEADRDRLTARVRVLEEALNTIKDGDVPRKVAHAWRADGSPSKHDECPHGLPMYEDCGACTAEFADAALSTASTHQPDASKTAQEIDRSEG